MLETLLQWQHRPQQQQQQMQEQEQEQPAADAFGGICDGFKLLWHCSCGII